MTTGQSKKRGSKILEKTFGPLRISDLLFVHRNKLGISQLAMAKRLNLSAQKLCDFEKGRRLPSPEVAEKWALALKLVPAVWVEAVLREQLRNCKTTYQVNVAA